MKEDRPVWSCSECGRELAAAELTASGSHEPCPRCGSTHRTVVKQVSVAIGISPNLRTKAKRSDSKKPYMETVSAHDVHRKTGRRTELTRVIDRLLNWYHEQVVDSEAGEAIHECSEPLDEHIGHGDARRPKKS
jgi:DNA-directed RNA polymerase subunit RPC12/RpoP